MNLTENKGEMMQAIIDSHAHLDFPEFDLDRGSLYAQMHSLGISQVVIPGVSADKWQNQIAIAKRYGSYFSLGVHPWYCENASAKDMTDLKSLLEAHKDDASLVGVGECGLDKLHKSNFTTQMKLFKAQICLAKEFDLPLIIHCVKAHEETLNLLKSEAPRRKGVIHGFYGGPQLAMGYVKLGYKLGIGGLLLNDNAPKLQQTVAELPLESFIVETDSPAMAPKNRQNIRNSPLILPEILKKMANLQKKSPVLISEQMFSNVTQLFDL